MIEKTIQDYYELMYKEFPWVSKGDIKKILLYGWRSFYQHNSYGADVLIGTRNIWLYCGQLMKDSIKWYDYYKRKLAIKLRILYKRYKVPYDGYYYFALTQRQYEDYLAQKKTRGRPKKWFTFRYIYGYKCQDECIVRESGKVAFFRLARPVEEGSTIFLRNYTTDKAELLEVRPPKKMREILITNREYELLDRRIQMLKNKYAPKFADLD